jgi:hypothetical protein
VLRPGIPAFMMYMSGNGVQIFSMMIVSGGIFQPIKVGRCRLSLSNPR